MQNYLKYILLSISTILGLNSTLNAAGNIPEPFRIIPHPRKVELVGGKGISFGDLDYLVMEGAMKRPVMGNILSLLPIAEKGGSMLMLKLDSTGIAPEQAEGYLLTIGNGSVEIVSKGKAGLFYGCQTLEQLLEDARDFNVAIPACKITDSPELAYRAVHFDVKHHLNHMNVYYEAIDRLARYKINAIIFEFEDKLRYVRQPLVGAPQAISIDEMAALTRYANERHIEISPLVQGLGHATFILKHQEYAHLRELPNNRWAFCPLHEGTYQVLFDLYRDAIEATPGSRYLHVGGDEIGNIGLCPRCKPTADKDGVMKLNLYWLKRVCEFAEENGRTPIVWDDMPLKEAGVYESTHKIDMSPEEVSREWKTGSEKLGRVIGEFPQNCVYMRWRYSIPDLPGNIKALDWYRQHGLKVMSATAAQSGSATLFPFDDRDKGMDSRGLPAIQRFAQLTAEHQLEGILCTAWDDRSPHFETYWRGFIASAEFSWSPYIRTLNEFDNAYLQREYGLQYPGLENLWQSLRKAAVFWERAFVKEGSRLDIGNTLFNLPGVAHWLPPKKEGAPIKTDFTDLLVELPNLEKPGNWSEKYAGRLDSARKIIEEYQSSSQTLKDLYDNSKKNRYHWKIFSALNDFQVTAPKLLLALKQCDTADSIKRQSGIEKINSALEEFNPAWDNLKSVYSETRFIDSPANYVPDRYFHFASQREDLTWMIQVEELFHNEINNWLKLTANECH